MAKIRLLQTVVGGPCQGAAGDELDVNDATARVWADGVRAELVAREAPRDGVVTADRRPPETTSRRARR